MSDELASQVSELRFAADLPAVVRRQLVEGATVVDVAEGDQLFHVGTPASEFYLIQQGEVSLEMQADDGRHVNVIDLAPGDIIGWSTLVGGPHMTTRAIAKTAAKVIVIDGNRVTQICEQDPVAGLHIMTSVARALATRLDKTRHHLLELLSRG